jgi:hypothetical protein
MLLEQHPSIRHICATLHHAERRHAAHIRLQPLIEELSQDKRFLFDALRLFLSRPGALDQTTRLSLPLYESGDISIAFNLFAPLRDGAIDVTCDNIHHHGWRVLTSAVICGEYHFIEFRRFSHESRTGSTAHLQLDKVANHVKAAPRTIDSHTPHVVFRPRSLCCTLAVWSADRPLLNQVVKRHTSRFLPLRRLAVEATRFLRLDEPLGLNSTRGLYYRVEHGRFVDANDYKTPDDGTPEEVLACVFQLMQLLDFDDVVFLRELAADSSPAIAQLIGKLLRREKIEAAGVWGDWRHRFSETQILQAANAVRPAHHASL